MIVESIIELKKSHIKQWPVNSNRASNLGHECLRYLVYERTRWQEKTLHGVELQTIFEEGNLHETAVLRDLQDAGFQVIEQQRAFQWSEYNITGHIDAKVLIEGIAVPIEIKSCSPWIFQNIETAADLYNGKYHHLRMYPAQMTLYLLMDNKDYGLFIFKNKSNGQLKEVRMDLDYELGERLLQKAEQINQHVSADTIPPHCDYDESVCGQCGYLHICLPDIKRDAMELKSDPELEAKLARMFELKPFKKEHDTIDKDLKKEFNRLEKAMIGNYLITGKEIQRKSYEVKAGAYWKTDIQIIGGDSNVV